MATRATIDHPESTGRDGAIDHMAKLLDGAPADSVGRKLYASPNGDTWYLVKDVIGPAIVHLPNELSGGQADRVTIGAFLAGGDGPEQQELLRLIGTLVDRD